MTLPTVTVVIPTFNRAALVCQTIENVLSQSLSPTEVVVIDDGSTDDTVRRLRQEFGPRITLLEQSNQGPGAARNAGLKIATGEFIWLMDSDDLASLNKLEVQVAALQQNNADVVYGPWARVFFEGQTIHMDGPVLQQRALPSNRDVLTWFMTDWSLVFQQCLFRHSIVKRAGLYRTDIWTCDDSEYFVRILAQGAKVVFEDASLTLYRCNDHGKVTGSGFQSNRRIIDWAKCLIAMHDQCRNFPSILIDPSYQIRLWKSVLDLKKVCSGEVDVIETLEARITRSRLSIRLRAFLVRLNKAVQTRTLGTHWPRSFQTERLTTGQKELMAQLGYTVIGNVG
jgi:glycosyltransferase involved in cell wall biosynthesis